jgi:hypothetical protein
MGASGKDRNTVVLGAVRTYARLEPEHEFSYGAWTESVRAGRTFVTDGPLLSLAVNGHEPGAVLPLSGQGARVRIQSEAHSVTPFTRLECLYNGVVIADAESAGDGRAAMIETEVPIDNSGWLAARCLGGEIDSAVRAHTSPVYVRLEGQPMRPEPNTMAPLLAVLDRTLAWVQVEARCPKEQQREQLMQTLQAARENLLSRGS